MLRNRDGTPWVWWIGIPRLVALAAVAVIGFRFGFGLGWLGAAIAVSVSFGLAALVWGTFAWMSATGRQLRLPPRVLEAAARRGAVTTKVECGNCRWRGATAELVRSARAEGGFTVSCPSCGREIGHSIAPGRA